MNRSERGSLGRNRTIYTYSDAGSVFLEDLIILLRTSVSVSQEYLPVIISTLSSYLTPSQRILHDTFPPSSWICNWIGMTSIRVISSWLKAGNPSPGNIFIGICRIILVVSCSKDWKSITSVESERGMTSGRGHSSSDCLLLARRVALGGRRGCSAFLFFVFLFYWYYSSRSSTSIASSIIFIDNNRT